MHSLWKGEGSIAIPTLCLPFTSIQGASAYSVSLCYQNSWCSILEIKPTFTEERNLTCQLQWSKALLTSVLSSSLNQWLQRIISSSSLSLPWPVGILLLVYNYRVNSKCISCNLMILTLCMVPEANMYAVFSPSKTQGTTGGDSLNRAYSHIKAYGLSLIYMPYVCWGGDTLNSICL